MTCPLHARSPRLLAAIAVAALAAFPPLCATASDRPSVAVGQTFLAGGLDPAAGSNGWALASHGIAEGLFTVSREGTVVPQLAAGATRNEDGHWTVTLAKGRMFSDGTPVDAAAVAAALNRTVAQNPAARATAGRIDFAVDGPLTLAVFTERPTPILPSILAEWPFKVYRRSSDDDFLFTGPYMVERLEPGARIVMSPNPHYAGVSHRPDVTIHRIADGQALALALQSGEIDLAFHLPVETISQVEADPDLLVKSFLVGYQYMMWLNTDRPALGDPRVRQAIASAIDAADLVRAVRGGEPARGAFPANTPYALSSAPEADPEAGAALLDEAGWTLRTDGVREKDGERLELTLWAYPQRPDLVTIQPVIRAALADIGIAVTTRVTETPTDAARAGDFDLLLWAQHTLPAGDPAFFLSLFLSSDGGNNFARWSNPAFDAIVRALGETIDPNARVRLAREAQAIATDAAPVVFLMTPKWHVGLSARLADYRPWGSDYYVLRPDLRVAR